MKINRLGALLILLLIAISIAVLYFYRQDKNPIVSDGDWRDQVEIYLDSESNSENFFYDELPESTYQERIDSVEISQKGNDNVYTIFSKQGFDVENNTGRAMIYYTGPEVYDEYNRGNYYYYILDKKIEGNIAIQRVQSVATGSIYNIPLFEFWIVGDLLATKNAIATLIVPINEKVGDSGACVVKSEDNYENEEGRAMEITQDGSPMVYTIEFDYNKATPELLSGLQDVPINRLCGNYSYSMGSNVFVSKNGIVLFFPEYSYWNQYNVGGFVSK